MPELTNADIIRAWAADAHSADAFGEEGDFAHQHLLNPTLFARLGNITGKQILDAGCGQGYLCRMLARKSASVTGLEPAESLYRVALQREEAEPLGITYIQHDLSTFTSQQNRFDVVIANMVLMDIPDYTAAMHNCVAVLKPGGDIIFSLVHPCFEEPGSEWLRKGYLEVREYLHEHVKPQTYGYLFHRPLSSYINFILQEGCILQHMDEPHLSQELARQLGNDKDLHVPSFIVIHATRAHTL